MHKEKNTTAEAKLRRAIFGDAFSDKNYDIQETEEEIRDRIRREEESRMKRQEMLKNPYWKRNIRHLKRMAEANEVEISHFNASLLMSISMVDGKCPMGPTTIHHCIDLINGN